MELSLPPIRLQEITPSTLDWLLAKAAAEGKDLPTVLTEILDQAARAAGFEVTETFKFDFMS